jgi:thioredoxin
MVTRALIGIGLGIAFGAAFGAFLKARGGACPLTCNPIGGAVFGAIVGFFLSAQFTGGTIEVTAHLPSVRTMAEFDRKVRASDKVVVVDFYRPDCPPCRRFAPTIAEMAQEYEGRVEFVKINTREAQDLAEALGVQATPTVMVYSRGNPVEQWSGIRDRENIRQILNEVLDGHNAEST